MKNDYVAILSLAFGILGLFFCFIPLINFVGLTFCFVSILLSIKGKNRIRNSKTVKGEELASIAMVLGIMGIIIFIISITIMFVFINSFM